MVDCVFKNSSEVLEAFRRNKNNTEIEVLYLNYLDDMTDEILEEILEIVASSASDNLFHLQLMQLGLVTRIPEAVKLLKNLQILYIGHMNRIQILPAGYIVSNNLSSVALNHLGNLSVIEPGAFQGKILQEQEQYIDDILHS